MPFTVSAAQKKRLREIDRAIEDRYPYLAADEARKAVGRGRDPTLGFGITPASIVVHILKAAKATKRDIFFDIGAGPGNCVLGAALFVRESHGVEVLPKLAALGTSAKRELKIKNARIHVREFQKTNLSKGTIFFCYSTCFNKQIMLELGDAIAAAPDGARVFTVSQALPHPAFEIVWRKELSWGRGKGTRSLFYQVRKPRPLSGTRRGARKAARR
ncbi:MAG: hypothetical protein JST92_14015 [Deltaproteobacteria bacterium]|nr:hypothetical protein [Deltaproteobacteria bacterium]